MEFVHQKRVYIAWISHYISKILSDVIIYTLDTDFWPISINTMLITPTIHIENIDKRNVIKQNIFCIETNQSSYPRNTNSYRQNQGQTETRNEVHGQRIYDRNIKTPTL